jgi:hypothetical protein
MQRADDLDFEFVAVAIVKVVQESVFQHQPQFTKDCFVGPRWIVLFVRTRQSLAAVVFSRYPIGRASVTRARV